MTATYLCLHRVLRAEGSVSPPQVSPFQTQATLYAGGVADLHKLSSIRDVYFTLNASGVVENGHDGQRTWSSKRNRLRLLLDGDHTLLSEDLCHPYLRHYNC